MSFTKILILNLNLLFPPSQVLKSKENESIIYIQEDLYANNILVLDEIFQYYMKYFSIRGNISVLDEI